jgi:hypothetical protein
MGLSVVVGLNAGIDFRILGVASEVPMSPMTRLFPIMWVGFVVNALSGTALLAADATTKLANPVFYVKLIFIALALVNLQLLRSKVFADPLVDKRPMTTNAKILAITSLLFWIGATTAGRLMAYIGPVSGLE